MEEYPLANKMKATLKRVLAAGSKTSSSNKPKSNGHESPVMPKVQANAPVAGINAEMHKKESSLYQVFKKALIGKENLKKESCKEKFIKAFGGGFGSYSSGSISRVTQRTKMNTQVKPKKPPRAGGAVKQRGDKPLSTGQSSGVGGTTSSVSYTQSVGTVS